ncbi:GFA family protein [Jannaschia formosa]|uniref:GFA family protein n=1 Tax=Jannaschia formosa TaxID=2259592 RepID=UPI000E1BE1F2|nr:GFA family protein [Jannaschia formosa]TFL18988.1 GFA family protein [Jannaschia formosa]
MAEPIRLTCHCGATELSVVLADGLATARRCDCSFCRRRGVAPVTVKEGDLTVVKGDTLTLYQWGTMTAEHWFCSVCGIYTHHRRRSNPREFGVNMGALDGVNPRDREPIGWVDGVNHPSDAGAA